MGAAQPVCWQRAGPDRDVSPASDTRQIWPSPTWRVAHVPSGRDGSGVTDLSVWLLAVPGGAPNVDAARDFVSAFSAPEMQLRLWPDRRVAAGDLGRAGRRLGAECSGDGGCGQSGALPGAPATAATLISVVDGYLWANGATAVRDGQPVPDLLTAAQSSALAVLQEENEVSS